jgi:hypothetical protein
MVASPRDFVDGDKGVAGGVVVEDGEIPSMVEIGGEVSAEETTSPGAWCKPGEVGIEGISQLEGGDEGLCYFQRDNVGDR